MKGEKDKELCRLFDKIYIDNDSDSETTDCLCSSLCVKPPPLPPREPPPATNIFIHLKNYIKDKCGNKLKILDRSTFYHIQRPIVICFNHFNEKCVYHTKYLDRIYQVSLKYDDRIEFIVADRMDIDVIYQHRNPIDFFSTFVSPEDESLSVYAIDEDKRIQEHFDVYHELESLMNLCENLIGGKLFPSQPISENYENFVKICVHANYDEVVTQSTKDILLVVGLEEYGRDENDYEKIAQDISAYNVIIVYMNGDKNYVPFEFTVNCYPTLIFIPHNEKDKFIHYLHGPQNTETVLDFIKENISPRGRTLRQREHLKWQYKPFDLPLDIEINCSDLNEYINEFYPNSLKVLDRNTFHTLKESIIIYFVNFQGKGIHFYLETLRLLHQVAEAKCNYDVDYLIADYKDIDIVYPKWYHKHLNTYEIRQENAKVFGIDEKRRLYTTDEFKTPASLFYFTYNMKYSRIYYSQPWSLTRQNDLITICVAENFKKFTTTSRKNIFLVVYRSSYKELPDLEIVQAVAAEVQQINVKTFKIDVKYNSVPLEYLYTSYPVYFFIPHRDQDTGTTRYIKRHPTKEEMLQFIRENNESRE